MKRIHLILNILFVNLSILLSSPIKGEERSNFQNFLTELKVWENTKFEPEIFGDTLISNILDSDEFENYLPKPIGLESVDIVCWNKGTYIIKSNYIAAFMRRFCIPNNDVLSFTEDFIITYSKDGEILDYKSVGKNGQTYFARENGDLSRMTFTVEQGVLENAEQLYNYGDLTFNVSVLKFTVNHKGQIRDKKKKATKVEIVPRDRELNDSVSFFDFLSYFQRINNLTKLPEDKMKEIPYVYIKNFLHDSIDCECYERALWWNSYCCVEANGIWTLIMSRNCDTPIREYPYADIVVATYTNEGTLIDCMTIARSGDRSEAKTDFSHYPIIRVKQTVYNNEMKVLKKNDTVYKIEGNGNIRLVLQYALGQERQ